MIQRDRMRLRRSMENREMEMEGLGVVSVARLIQCVEKSMPKTGTLGCKTTLGCLYPLWNVPQHRTFYSARTVYSHTPT
jgi:hypothetical protein